ncbi:hypothetical protein ACSMEB_12855 [Stenotrophomonas maltophilia]|uniref:hypothetical protein n=1 Tax=Stenotrophomonas maltophilia TaxID=40324 RepID=UPI000746DCAD|nr:hypothetical protein [Stenotrophomonas maltophilia]EKT4097440.1 hypothetical protein [Stenotrophomonas maltophilia]KUJ01464.1 hypothetical protein AR275_09385 [Stenotrophomonas maltophilia]MBA0442422.1 hypothetical protein [Stenotrophomonas maltophilia]PZS54897.1 hypothetical protein A7X58_13870 [Stenotrophomonas maltophilia]
MRDPDSNALEFVAGCAVNADIYYLAAALGPGHEYYDPDPGPPSRMFVFGRAPQEGWFHHDLLDFQVMSTLFMPPENSGGPQRLLALDYWGQLEYYGRAGAAIERVKADTGGLTRIRKLGEDLFCCGVHGMIYHRNEAGWKQLPTRFPTPERRNLEDELDSMDFETWLLYCGHIFELDGAAPLPTDPAKREAELRQKFEETRSQIAEGRKDREYREWLASVDVPSVNDLCGTGPADLYAIGSDGLIAHWNGLNWTLPEQVTTAELFHACRTDQGRLVVVGKEGTIITGDISTGFERLRHDASEDINFNSACQHGQQIFIGTEYGGLYVYSLETGVVEPLLEGIPEELREATIVDISSVGGVLWVLTPWDLTRFDGIEWQVIVHPDNG